MGRTQYYTATSIDGFIADETNSLDWLFEVPADDRPDGGFAAFFAGVGAMAMGATTYRWALEHDHLVENPSRWQDYYGAVPCWVFSHGELPAVAGADVSFVSGDVRAVHEEMTRTAGGRNVWLVGGGELVGQFADHGLLDEIVLTVAPVMLGAGAPLLPRRLAASDLSLSSVERRGQFVSLTYQVGRAGR